MDEQMMEQQETNSPAPEEEEILFEDEAPISEAEAANSELSVNKEGELEFSDEYLGESEKSFFGERQLNNNLEPEPKQPQYYTDEELNNTPYEQWDINRLNGDIRKFAPIVQQQIARRQAQYQANQAMQQNTNAFSQFMSEPKPYTPKELAEDAQSLAIQNLGLEDPDDFDEYEGEHRAALNLAMQELASRRQSEIANYQRASGEFQQLQRFNAELAARPDFKEFDNWYINKLREKNLTPEQVNAGLWKYAENNGYRFGEIPGIIAGWYQEFQQSKNSRPKAKVPPSLESSNGSGYYGGRSVNLKNFGDMNIDQQAKALMQLGIV